MCVRATTDSASGEKLFIESKNESKNGVVDCANSKSSYAYVVTGAYLLGKRAWGEQ